MKTHSRYKVARIIQIFWSLFIGIGAVGGAIGMLVAPDGSAMGMQSMLQYFQVLPFANTLFQNYIFPGIALLCVNGIPNLIAALLLFKKKKSGSVLSGILGITLMLWICIQFVILPTNPLSISYFIFGILQAITGYAAVMFYEQEIFIVNIDEYTNIGKSNNNLVIYFSRMGYTQKVALEEANKTGAELYEIKATEKIDGTPGFWWCGRFAMHKWAMPIEPLSIDLSKYEHITICTPVWSFSLAGPVREFCKEASGKIKSVDYIITHHMNANFENVSNEMDTLLAVKATKVTSIACPLGVQKQTKKLR